MGNRVEDLETQVAELRATVNALTEELVETKERVKQLEDAESEPDRSTATADPTPPGDTGAELVGDGPVTVDGTEPSADAADEEAKSSGTEDGDDEGGSGADDGDIIVA